MKEENEGLGMRIKVTHQTHTHTNKFKMEYHLTCIQSKDKLLKNEVFVNVVDEGNGWGCIEISKPTIDSMLKPLKCYKINTEAHDWRQVKLYNHKLKCEIPEGEYFEEPGMGCDEVKFFYFETNKST